MLEITIPGTEMWDEKKQEFVYTTETTLTLEHSLISISKWEAIWKRCFLKKGPQTYEENLSYIECMSIGKIKDPNVLRGITEKDYNRILDYIQDPMTASYIHTFGSEQKNKRGSSTGDDMTSEMIYFYMCNFNIPFECEKWHLNRLLKLIEISNMKNNPGKKVNPRDLTKSYAKLNAERRAKYHTKG